MTMFNQIIHHSIVFKSLASSFYTSINWNDPVWQDLWFWVSQTFSRLSWCIAIIYLSKVSLNYKDPLSPTMAESIDRMKDSLNSHSEEIYEDGKADMQ